MSRKFYEIIVKMLCNGSTKSKKFLLISAMIALHFSVAFDGYCLDRSYAASSPETPVQYYECIDGACDSRKVRWKPSITSYELEMSPIKNQNPLGTCTSFTVGACAEKATIHRARDRKSYYYPVSEAEFTVYTEQNTSGGDCKQGLNLGEALRVATDRGFISEEYWPYREYLNDIRKLNGMKQRDKFGELIDICPRHKYTKKQLASIQKFKLDGVNLLSHVVRHEVTSAVFREVHRAPLWAANRNQPIYIPSVKIESEIDLTMKAFLQNREPIAVSLPTFNNWDNSGDISMPTLAQAKRWTDSKEPKALIYSRAPFAFEDYFTQLNLGIEPQLGSDDEGWHAIVITGYNDNKKAFKFKNSWGVTWGHEGYGWLPYDYVTQYASEIVATH